MVKIIIDNGRSDFYQWDLNQLVRISGCVHKCRVHFAQGGEPLTVDTTTHEDGTITAPVPNIMLQIPKALTCFVYIYDDPEDAERYTIAARRFYVHERPKPVDYVYTETEVKTWEALMDAVNADLEHINEAEAEREAQERQRETNEEQRNSTHGRAMENVERAVADAREATTQAQIAADWANSAGNEAQRAVDSMSSSFANSLKADKSGSIIRISDVSPLQEDISVHLTSDTLDTFEGVRVKKRGKNLTPVKYYSKTSTAAEATSCGITFTLNDDGTVHAQGVATANALFYITTTNDAGCALFKAGTYFVSGCPSGGSATSYYFNVRTLDQSRAFNDIGGGALMTLTEDTKLVMLLRVNKGTDISQGITFKPQIELGVYPTDYEKPADAIDCQVEADGSIYYFEPFGEHTTIEVDSPDAKINAKYSRDINKAFAEIYSIMQVTAVAAVSDLSL